MAITSLDNLIQTAESWFASKGWEVFPFQKETWQAYLTGHHGLVNAPTGSGKTYSLFIAAALRELQSRQEGNTPSKGLQVIWVTPIRALAKEIKMSCQRASDALGLDWEVDIRSGDTSSAVRQKQIKHPPHMLITTPESIHVLLGSKTSAKIFWTLKSIIVDEWHELMGSKRGVQMELALSRFRGHNPDLITWGISATIGNMDEAMDVLFGVEPARKCVLIKADIKKQIEVESLIPKEMEKFPWSGHIGLKMLPEVVDVIYKSNASLIFTNTRANCEIWYQALLDYDPELSGAIAMHHGSISRELRDWVEDALYKGKLKAVVCTSSLDLGVDFRPVETIIQIGSPKGVARFVQRAGRSGHQPGAVSRIYFVPTHAIELLESSALRSAVEQEMLEHRMPYLRSWDVLIQYLMTLAVGGGFDPQKVYQEVCGTVCYESMTKEEWQEVLTFLIHGSKSLAAYDEYHKVVIEDGMYKVPSRGVAMRHRMSIGTIISDAMVRIKYVKGKQLGSVEEYFISLLTPGDVFWFAGRALELVRLKEMTAFVRNASKKSKNIPSYMGGRMQLSSQLSQTLRDKLIAYTKGETLDAEVRSLIPLLELQKERSALPTESDFLIEYFETKEGHHLIMYPFEGRNVHEGVGALIASRISAMMPITFSIAMNDYGFELLSDKKIDIEKVLSKELFSSDHLVSDIQSSINAVELAKRQFRDIAIISGLIFTGYPGKQKKNRHLQSSSELLFKVFHDYEPDNMLYLQTYDEVMTFTLQEDRIRKVLDRIRSQKMVIKYPNKPTPFSFPLLVDRLRQQLSSEKLADRIGKMSLEID